MQGRDLGKEQEHVGEKCVSRGTFFELGGYGEVWRSRDGHGGCVAVVAHEEI
jgi:hypothetical protein